MLVAQDRPLKRAGAEVGMIASLGQVVPEALGYFETVAFFKQQVIQSSQQDGHVVDQMLLARRIENHDLVDTVEELKAEVRL